MDTPTDPNAPVPYVPPVLQPTVIDHVISPEEATALAALFPTLTPEQRAAVRAGMFVTVDTATQKKKSVAEATASGLNFLGTIAGIVKPAATVAAVA